MTSYQLPNGQTNRISSKQTHFTDDTIGRQAKNYRSYLCRTAFIIAYSEQRALSTSTSYFHKQQQQKKFLYRRFDAKAKQRLMIQEVLARRARSTFMVSKSLLFLLAL